MNIYLIRHGKLNWEDNIKKCIGITDTKLSNEGIKMIEELISFIKDKNISKIYTSDLNRCEKSAQILSSSLKIPYYTQSELREINMGIWENKSFDYIKEHYPLEYDERGKNIETFKVENGESFYECYNRSVNIFKKLQKENKNIAIICHSGVIKCLLCYLKNIPLNNILNIKLNYGDIVCISYKN